ncbi:MAG: hypothetical protein J5I47_10825 [Vicingus serpentipes]|nr:hypothetical protein [Vicingus serpentipes]
MKPRNNIDSFFKEKLEHREFEIKDSFIADLEQKLDERKKKRRGIFFLVFLSVGLLPFGYYIFNFNNNEILEKVNPSNIEQETILETNPIPKKENVFLPKEKAALVGVVNVNKGGEMIENQDKTTSLKSDDDEKEPVDNIGTVKKRVSRGVSRHIGINGNANVPNYRLVNKESRDANHEAKIQLESPSLLGKKAPKKESYRKIVRRESEEQIEELKQGTLLVRLKTSNNKINALKKVGNIEKALKVKAEQDLENKQIISAFKHYFNFCDVVFFHSNHSNNVRAKKLSNIFLNDSLMIDGSIKVDTNRAIFIAEFGSIEAPSTSGFQALIIKNDEFVQLKRPFPYYVRTSFKSMKQHPEQALFLAPILPFQNWTFDATVIVMNEKLNEYFDKIE